MPEPPKELPAFPNEAAFQQKLKERRQRVEELEVEQKPSIHNCVFISIFWFFLTMVFPILMTYIIPKFKTIFVDMLGPGETLPEFTLLVVAISDAIKNNALITLPLWGSIWLGFAYFMGFKRRFLEKNLCKSINALSIVLYLVFLLCVVLAMFLPLIKMKDKLGQ
jgi:type II secretory pathway component PulF